MNIFKRIKLFKEYRRAIAANKEELFRDYKIKVDKVYRLYTVFTVEEADYRTYGKELVDAELVKYLRSVDQYLQNIGLKELYGVSEKEQLSDREYRIVIRFAYLDTQFWANALVIVAVSLISLIVMGAVFFGLYALFIA